MAASYPGSVKTFTTKTNKVDLVDASHINDAQLEIAAIQTELGTDPAGDQTNLKTRLAYNIEDNGSLKHGTSFPVSPRAGDWFFRTDTNVAHVYTGSTWSAQSGITAYTAGDYVVNFVPVGGIGASDGTGSGTYAKVAEIYVPRGGALRVKFWLAAVGNTSYGRIYKNGSAVGTEQSIAAGSGAEYSEDISGIAAGDLIQLYAKTSGSRAVVGGLRLYEGTPNKEAQNYSTYPFSVQYTSNGTPNSALGNIGDTCLNTAGGASTTLYVKTGAGTWTAK